MSTDQPSGPPAPRPPRWANLQASVRPEIRDLARATVRGMIRTTGTRFTMRDFVEAAVAREAARLAAEGNNGTSWADTDDDSPLGPGPHPA